VKWMHNRELRHSPKVRLVHRCWWQQWLTYDLTGSYA
jgi:hypothetical protein